MRYSESDTEGNIKNVIMGDTSAGDEDGIICKLVPVVDLAAEGRPDLPGRDWVVLVDAGLDERGCGRCCV